MLTNDSNEYLLERPSTRLVNQYSSTRKKVILFFVHLKMPKYPLMTSFRPVIIVVKLVCIGVLKRIGPSYRSGAGSGIRVLEYSIRKMNEYTSTNCYSVPSLRLTQLISIVIAQCPSCVVHRPPTFHLKIYSFLTTWQNLMNLGRDVSCMKLYQRCAKNSISCRTLVAIRKNFKYLLLNNDKV